MHLRTLRGRAVPLLAAVLTAALVPAAPASAAGHAHVALVPEAGTTITFEDEEFAGTLLVRLAADGLVLVERTDIDGYLAGIAEVPFSWPEEALAAQVVAARSYLASTLRSGRAGAGATYGFDICASSACQVYAGAGNVAQPSGDRWLAAVRRTASEILIYEGAPARTFYFSTSGGATAAVQDVWAGSAPVPYLRGAVSPGESSPFVRWRVAVPMTALVAMLDAGGRSVGGAIESVAVIPSAAGTGVWRARIVGDERTVSMDVAELRTIVNRHGGRLFPELIPALRTTGTRRYPQGLLSYRYFMKLVEPELEDLRAAGPFPDADLPAPAVVLFEGRGWGHHVGMSQYGAAAMANRGASYDEILAHYYGGLEPVAAPGVLPAEVDVGLAWERGRLTFDATGPFTLQAGDRPIEGEAGERWTLLAYEGRIVVLPPLSRLTQLTIVDP